MTMKSLSLLIAVVSLVGCTDVGAYELEQADKVIAVYERDYGDMTDSQVECVREVRVNYTNDRRIERSCSDWAVGCTIVGPFRGRIRIRKDRPEAEIPYTLRHEYTHILMWCMTGNPFNNHQTPEFGYSGVVNGVGSLAEQADTLE